MGGHFSSEKGVLWESNDGRTKILLPGGLKEEEKRDREKKLKANKEWNAERRVFNEFYRRNGIHEGIRPLRPEVGSSQSVWRHWTKDEYEDRFLNLTKIYNMDETNSKWRSLVFAYLTAQELEEQTEEGRNRTNGSPTKGFSNAADAAMGRLHVQTEAALKSMGKYSQSLLKGVGAPEECELCEVGADSWWWPFGKKEDQKKKEEKMDLNAMRGELGLEPDEISNDDPRLKQADKILRDFYKQQGFDRPSTLHIDPRTGRSVRTFD
jgi:hypothetical protein